MVTVLKRETHQGLDHATMLGIYRTMYLSRAIDDKEIQLKAQNKIYFQISGAGHEAILVAAGLALKPAYDWFYPYYRDRALCLQLGVTPLEMLLSGVGAEADPSSHGRQMPSHWGNRKLNIVTSSSPTGTQLLQAVGCAEATYRASLIEEIRDKISGFKGDEVTYVSAGDGATSEGEFWESLNTASNLRLPIVFVIEDNGYAISVPVEVQTPGGSISNLVSNFPDLYVQKCDGTDPIESLAAMKRAVQFCRARKGAALVHASVIRPYSHSLSDDERLYRPVSEREADAKRDPITRFARTIVAEGIASAKELEGMRKEVDRLINEAADIALGSPQPAPETATLYVYSPDVDPCAAQFDTESEVTLSGNPGTMVDLINRCLHDEMARDHLMVVFGEDVADCSREEFCTRSKVKVAFLKSPQICKKFSAQRVSTTLLWQRPISWAAQLGWLRAV